MAIVESSRINADAEKVFDAYVHHIDTWIRTVGMWESDTSLT